MTTSSSSPAPVSPAPVHIYGERVCLVCKKTFVARYSGEVACSDACRLARRHTLQAGNRRRSYAKKKASLAALVKELAALRERLQALSADHAALEEEADAWRAERDALQGERDAWQAEKAALQAERDARQKEGAHPDPAAAGLNAARLEKVAAALAAQRAPEQKSAAKKAGAPASAGLAAKKAPVQATPAPPAKKAPAPAPGARRGPQTLAKNMACAIHPAAAPLGPDASVQTCARMRLRATSLPCGARPECFRAPVCPNVPKGAKPPADVPGFLDRNW